MALEYLKQMKDSCNRSELLKSMWALEASGHIFGIPTGSGFLVDPVNDDDFDKVQGRGASRSSTRRLDGVGLNETKP